MCLSVRELRREKQIVQDVLFSKLISDRCEKRKVFILMKRRNVKIPTYTPEDKTERKGVSKWDCINYSKCLMASAVSKSESMPCGNCSKYQSEPLSIEDYIYNTHDEGEYYEHK
jgi:hypothetical protein